MQKNLFSEETKARIAEKNPYFYQNKWLEKTDAKEVLDKLLYVDTKTYLHELLMKQDQMSMAASIESRVPFLDYKLVELTAKMPAEMKLRGKDTKWILRKVMRGILPDEILNRAKKGFPVPFGNWLRNEYKYIIDEYVLSERALSRGIFNADFVRNLVRQHERGENHDERLWLLVNFEIWQRRFFDGEKAKKPGIEIEEAVPA
jgi:asparagine synthase (glutamine-hydrolysing)